MKAILTATIAALAVSSAKADFFNGFESGLAGVSIVGDASLVDETFFTPVQAPPGGLQQLLLTTLSTVADGGNASGTDATTRTGLESFFGLQAFSIPTDGALGDGSGAKLTLTLAVGDIVSFNYNFLTSAGFADGQDFAFYTLQFGGDTPELFTFAEVANAFDPSNSAYFDFETGVGITILDPITVAGTYTLGFGIADKTDDAVASGLLIDNVQVVPEPASAMFVLAGIAGLAGLRRTRRA